jgi:hypothetical protein
MEPQSIIEAFPYWEQAPGLVVLSVIVWQFLRHLQSRDEAFGKVIREIGQECHQTQHEAITAMNRNTEMMGEVRSLLHRVLDEHKDHRVHN